MLTYQRINTLDIVGFCDANYIGYMDDKKSTTFMMARGAVSWKSVKQTLTTSSTMEAEYIACYEATCSAMWLRNLVFALGVVASTTVSFFKNTRSTCCSKHIDIKFYFVKEKVVEGIIDI